MLPFVGAFGSWLGFGDDWLLLFNLMDCSGRVRPFRIGIAYRLLAVGPLPG